MIIGRVAHRSDHVDRSDRRLRCFLHRLSHSGHRHHSLRLQVQVATCIYTIQCPISLTMVHACHFTSVRKGWRPCSRTGHNYY